MTGFCGLTTRPTGAGALTVRVAGVVAETPPDDAEIMAEPELKVEATPLNAGTLLIVAMLPD